MDGVKSEDSLYTRSRLETWISDIFVGFKRGTQYVHSIPSSLNTIPEKREWDREIDRTNIEKISKTLTILGETALYGYLASEGNLWWILPIFTNIVDFMGYVGSHVVTGEIYGLWEDEGWFTQSLYHDFRW
ncbi:MAG: hypothetical protein KJ674_01300 [Nanoarchaeota archaeon]|nr:hypothetical protein [Nanoarchaeota archaeon]